MKSKRIFNNQLFWDVISVCITAIYAYMLITDYEQMVILEPTHSTKGNVFNMLVHIIDREWGKLGVFGIVSVIFSFFFFGMINQIKGRALAKKNGAEYIDPLERHVKEQEKKKKH